MCKCKLQLVKVSHAKTSSVIHNQGQKFVCIIFVAQKYWQKVAVHVIAQFCQLTYYQCFTCATRSCHVTANVTDHSDKQTLEKGKIRIVTGASLLFLFFVFVN